jgi:hypothetical protein
MRNRARVPLPLLQPLVLCIAITWSTFVVHAALIPDEKAPFASKTSVSIVGDEFFVNAEPTYRGRIWNGHKIQGLLFNSRMVQGIFDDRNLDTIKNWVYPDTRRWDPERNTREFIAAMPEWRRHGLLAFTINLQGGSPQAIRATNAGTIPPSSRMVRSVPTTLGRLERILNKADQLGMVVILGYFYFGQDQWLKDEAAVIRATDNASQWIFDRGYRNVLVEINNECNVRYHHGILGPERVHELIQRVRERTYQGRRLYVGTSYPAGPSRRKTWSVRPTSS